MDETQPSPRREEERRKSMSNTSSAESLPFLTSTPPRRGDDLIKKLRKPSNLEPKVGDVVQSVLPNRALARPRHMPHADWLSWGAAETLTFRLHTCD